ncbi:PREDICTED: uncharacterized protein LOC104807761 [Tarenaya hassleriana]|uniref:uncharacterized protein LOC104807761 n=1 Tax=Tarenaya hassleriana TaxID=28532 RepID=UPI00053C7DFC|nr:PREDICTED: uncharacterized protein LOC104807761 [Tarenaya hassleriana]XP_010531465.1 PREDICTED: uncharacterized protein LOC104807761 [Tarenaya hassleriana]XP_010531466.1 PREDICTED: uncharacterized protein LOC104807761 [Tarenaya hassleriana]
MATVTSSSSCSSALFLHHLLRHPKQSSSVCLFVRPFCASTFTQKANQHLEPRFRSFLASFSSPSLPPLSSSISLSGSLSSLFISRTYSSVPEPELGEDEDNASLSALSVEEEEEEDSLDPALLSLVESEDLGVSEGDKEEKKAKPRNSGLKMTVKEKKELSSYAHSLGKKLKCQLVGKSGVTDTVVSSFLETLEKNELLKVKIHRTCPGELEDVVQNLEEATGSVVVGQIGRTVIVYRPSLTKMRAEEKRKENQRTFLKRTPPKAFSPSSRKDYAATRSSGRGRRGGSRVATA